MARGYMGKTLAVDLSTGRIDEEALDESLCRDFLGGYGIGASILYDRMDAGVDALGPDNLLGFYTGPLTGSPSIEGNRSVTVCKSPLTDTWGDANCGGTFGPQLKFAGYDGILFKGIADHKGIGLGPTLENVSQEESVMARVAIYYRVSTVDQSVAGQIAELRKYAKRRKFKIAGEYVDQCSGAARKRPQLDEMMADVRQRKADVVLVWAFDRFARSTSHLVSTLEELQAVGVDFISYKQQIDTSTAAGKLTFTVLAAIAEFEREMIRERVKTGMANAMKAGTKSGNPIGRPKISASKQSRIRQMRKEGVSYAEIAKKLSLGKSCVYRYANA